MFSTKSQVDTNMLIARDGWQCYYCQKFLTANLMTVDHLTPTLRGGADTVGNTVISCLPCNARKGDMNLEEYRHWLGVRYYAYELAPHEVIELGPIEVVVGDSSTIIALPALWEGTRFLCDDALAWLDLRSAYTVLMTRKRKHMHVVFLGGVLWEHYDFKH